MSIKLAWKYALLAIQFTCPPIFRARRFLDNLYSVASVERKVTIGLEQTY